MRRTNDDERVLREPRRHDRRSLRQLADDIGDAGRELVHILRRASRQERRCA